MLELASLLGLSLEKLPELELAFDRPGELLARFQQAFASRGIDDEVPQLPWIRLVDALCDERRCAEIDWKADLDEVAEALAQLGLADKAMRRVLARADGESTEATLGRLGHHVTQKGRALCSIDHGADSYALVLLDPDAVARAQALATDAGFGAIIVWNKKPARAPRAPKSSAPKLVDLAAWDFRWPNLVALPGGQAVVLKGTELHLLTSGRSAQQHQSVDDLVPDPKRGPFGELALFRCGAGFGVLSNRRVRLWPTASFEHSVTLAIDVELPADKFGRRPAPAACGGTSERADQAVVVFHEAGSVPETIFLVRLSLDLQRGSASLVERNEDGQLPVLPREAFPLSTLARLQPGMFRHPLLQHARLAGDEVLVCATAPGEKALVHLASVGAEGKTQVLLSIEEPARAQFTASGQFMIVTFAASRRIPRQALWSLRERAWVTPFDLHHASKIREIVDHDAGVWWLFDKKTVVASAVPTGVEG